MRKMTYAWAAVALLVSTAVQAENFCSNLANSFGPLDYRKGKTEYTYELYLVESTHYLPEIANGIHGHTGTIANDLDYTLRAFPNHIPALTTLDLLAQRQPKLVTLDGARFPTECYFERAVRFMPDDGAARAAYGNYLYSRGKTDAAFKMFLEAERLKPDDPSINYNLGLLYMKKKDYEKARLYGRKAYQLGFPLAGLKNQLIAVGKWEDKAE